MNNAGITRDAMFHRMTPEQWSAVITTNLNSLFNMCRPVIEGMRSRKFGRIINISSINGQKGQLGQSNYSAAKAGELGFTKALVAGKRAQRHHRQRDLPRLYRDRHGEGDAQGRPGEEHPAADSGRPAGRARGDRALRRLSRVRRGRSHHRLDVSPPMAGSISPDPQVRLGSSLTTHDERCLCGTLASERALPRAEVALCARRPVPRRQLEAGKLESRRHRAADQRPVAGALRRLPGVRRTDRLRTLAGGEIGSEPQALDSTGRGDSSSTSGAPA